MKYDDRLKCNVLKRKNFLKKKRKTTKKIVSVFYKAYKDVKYLRDVELTERS